MSLRGFVLYCLTNGVVIALIVVLGFYTHYRLVAKAEAAARAERDAHWTAEIERSNAETEKRLRLQAETARAADAIARDAIDAANLKILELEKANEALPDTRCGGLGRARVELLLGPR